MRCLAVGLLALVATTVGLRLVVSLASAEVGRVLHIRADRAFAQSGAPMRVEELTPQPTGFETAAGTELREFVRNVAACYQDRPKELTTLGFNAERRWNSPASLKPFPRLPGDLHIKAF